MNSRSRAEGNSRVPARAPERRHRALALPRGRNDFLRQLAIWFGFVIAYQFARGLADRGAGEAFANARRVIHVEERLGAFFEPDLQRPVVETGGLLLHAVDWTYWLSQFAVVGLVLLWIYLRRNESYLWVRNAIIVAHSIGLVGYVAMPTAPPRLFPELGFTDTLAQAEVLNHGTSLVELAANAHAAMPSLHAADALIIGFALTTVVRPRVLKALFALWPAWVAFSLIASGNHFWLDIAAGAVLAAVGVWVARRLERRPPAFLRIEEATSRGGARGRPAGAAARRGGGTSSDRGQRQNRSGLRGLPRWRAPAARRHFHRRRVRSASWGKLHREALRRKRNVPWFKRVAARLPRSRFGSGNRDRRDRSHSASRTAGP